MDNNRKYVILSLELHLFFARIMKEHSLFLEAGFTPANVALAEEAEFYKEEFETLLFHTVNLSNGLIRPRVLKSGEIVTEFTACAEQQTQRFTGIPINGEITAKESRLCWGENIRINPELFRRVKHLNQTSIRMLDGLICFKEKVLSNVLCCKMFTMNYPLLLEHIIREAKLYRTYVRNYENGMEFDCKNMVQTEQFWNRIMMEHALFIRGLLDPTENELIETSNSFAEDYARLLTVSKEMHDKTIIYNKSLEETLNFRDFKQAGTKGIQDCKIRSIILPLLADHVLREANHYVRLLSD